MEGAGDPQARLRGPRSASRRRDAALEARLAHPVFDAVRPWFERLDPRGEPPLDKLNRLAEEAGVRTESGRQVSFVHPGSDDRYYEVRVYETGRIATRPAS